MKQNTQRFFVMWLSVLVPSVFAEAATKPVRVFVLAGQSNMVGHGFIAADPNRNSGQGSLAFLVKDPATANRFGHLVDTAGHWRTRDDVWISLMKAQAAVAEHPEFTGNVVQDGAQQKLRWVPLRSEDVPEATGLKQVRLDRSREDRPEPYVTPDDAASCWKKPGPVAGPFQARLGDGSVVTYYWYRFADQPALLNADLTDQQRTEVRCSARLVYQQDHPLMRADWPPLRRHPGGRCGAVSLERIASRRWY